MTATEPGVREQTVEWVKIASDPLYFTARYVKIKPEKEHVYVPFRPWPSQEQVFEGIDLHKYVVILKARQLGMTLIVLVYALWVALVEPHSHVFLISRKKEDAHKLLRKLRLMYRQLPKWLTRRCRVVVDNAGTLEFDNGSIFTCFASNKSAADGLTGRLCVIDEADLIADLDLVLNGVMPAIFAAGQLIILSKSNKDLQESKFKTIYRDAVAGRNDFWPVFLNWRARPDRSEREYEEAKRNGSIDYLWENYPESAAQALAPRQEAKRLPLRWLEACSPPLDDHGVRRWPVPVASPAVLAGVQGLRIYDEPEPGREYVIGVDLASGRGQNPNLDDSAAVIFDKRHARQVGVLVAQIEPALFAEHVATLARYYNRAGVLPELNGQWGGQFFQYMRDKCGDVRLLRGLDGKNPGWTTTQASKSILYEKLAEAARCGGFTIQDEQTFTQLASIESNLEAPPGLHDDVAMATAIALWAAETPVPSFDFETVDIGLKQPPAAGKPRVPDSDGIAYLPTQDSYSVSVPPRHPDRTRQQRVNVGNYPTEAQARLAHNHASRLLGYPPVHPDPSPGEVTARDIAAIESQVRTRLVRERQL